MAVRRVGELAARLPPLGRKSERLQTRPTRPSPSPPPPAPASASPAVPPAHRTHSDSIAPPDFLRGGSREGWAHSVSGTNVLMYKVSAVGLPDITTEQMFPGAADQRNIYRGWRKFQLAPQ